MARNDNGENKQNAVVFGTVLIALVIALSIQRSCSDPVDRSSRSARPSHPQTAEVEATPTPVEEPPSPTPMLATETPSATPTQSGKLLPLSPQQVVVRRSQIKDGLNSMHSALVSYFAEFNRYSTDLAALGYRPESGELKFKIGFLEPFETAGMSESEVPSRKSTDSYIKEKDQSGKPYFVFDPYAAGVDLSQYARYCKMGCTARGDSFEVMAAVNLDDDPTLDVWVIDNLRNITHVVDDERE